MNATTVPLEKPQPSPEAILPLENETEVGAYLWTCDEYLRLASLGFFDDKRVELLEGEILRMPPQYPPHAIAIRRTFHTLMGAFGLEFNLSMQLPITISNRSEPEPDVTVARGSMDNFADHHPGPAEIALLVEVSDSTLRRDRERKAHAYARVGITDYWIVNLVDRQLEAYRDPMPDGRYLDVKIYKPEETISSLALPNSEVRVSDLLPPAPEH